MSIKSDLKKEGIEVVSKLDTLKVNSIAKTISEKLTNAFPEHNFKSDDLFKKIARLNMYTAKIPNGLSEANYYYKNTSIYYNEKIDLKDIYKYAIHECIHYIQEKKTSHGRLLKMGLSDLSGVRVYGIGINEAAVQYATSKALNYSKDSVKYYGITFNTVSPNFYPIECNLIEQMSYITGDYSLLDSTFYSNNNFRNKFIELTSKDAYEIVEENFDKILFAEEDLIKLNNRLLTEDKDNNSIKAKIEKLKAKIKSIYFETQNLLISSYFNKAFDNIKTIEEIEVFRKRIYDYQNLIGSTEEYYFFNNFYIAMMEKLEAKYNAIELGFDYNFDEKANLTLAKENKFILIINMLKKILFNKDTKEIDYQKN